jgi:1,4-dihydroxy-2-naphthoate octaprenyltransferase
MDTGRLRAYMKLAKIAFYDYYLCVLVAGTVSIRAGGSPLRTVAMLTVFDLGWFAVVAATRAFDDVTGFRDGSDDVNYRPNQAVLRDRSRKPLLTGQITEREAVAFGYAATAAGAALWMLAVLIAPHPSIGAAALAAFTLFIAVQYSYGLRFSYRGGQEAVLLLSTALAVLVPYWLAAGRLSSLALLESFLFGLWSLLVSVYSNVNDVAGDRAVGRINVATSVSPRAYRWFVVLLTTTEVIAVGAALAAGAAPPWLALFLLPVLVVRVRQLHIGLLRGEPLAARRLGRVIHRVGVVLLVSANLVVYAAG